MKLPAADVVDLLLALGDGESVVIGLQEWTSFEADGFEVERLRAGSVVRVGREEVTSMFDTGDLRGVPVNRAERRHQERRIKARWLRRLLRLPLRRGMRTETWWAWAVRYASIRAHHGKCPCDTCSGYFQRLRHHDIKLARKEARRVGRDGADE